MGRNEDPEAMPPDPGMPLPLRCLAGVGALAFVLLGVNLLLVGLQSLRRPPQRQPSPEPPAARGQLSIRQMRPSGLTEPACVAMVGVPEAAPA